MGGRIGSRGQKVEPAGFRHISTSGLAPRALRTVVFALFWPIWPPYRPWWPGDRSKRSRSTAEYYFRSGQTGSSSISTSGAYIKQYFVKNMSPESLAVDLVTRVSDRKYFCKTGSSYEYAGNGLYRYSIALGPFHKVKIVRRTLLPVPTTRK